MDLYKSLGLIISFLIVIVIFTMILDNLLTWNKAEDVCKNKGYDAVYRTNWGSSEFECYKEVNNVKIPSNYVFIP